MDENTSYVHTPGKHHKAQWGGPKVPKLDKRGEKVQTLAPMFKDMAHYTPVSVIKGGPKEVETTLAAK